mgnify:CR=1 FL=1
MGLGACIFVQDFLAVRGLAVVLLLLAKLMVDTGRPALAMIAGRPAIAYRDGAKGHLKLAVNDSADGRGKWQVTVVYPGTPDGPRTQSLAAIDGRAGIAFEDATRGLLFAYDPGLPSGNYWPVALVDERLSSAAASQDLREIGITGRRQKAMLDQVAAQRILQSYLDEKNHATT